MSISILWTKKNREEEQKKKPSIFKTDFLIRSRSILFVLFVSRENCALSSSRPPDRTLKPARLPTFFFSSSRACEIFFPLLATSWKLCRNSKLLSNAYLERLRSLNDGYSHLSTCSLKIQKVRNFSPMALFSLFIPSPFGWWSQDMQRHSSSLSYHVESVKSLSFSLVWQNPQFCFIVHQLFWWSIANKLADQVHTHSPLNSFFPVYTSCMKIIWTNGRT